MGQLDADDRLQVTDGPFTLDEHLQHAHASRVRQRLEEVRLDLGQGHGRTGGFRPLMWHMTNLSTHRIRAAQRPVGSSLSYEPGVRAFPRIFAGDAGASPARTTEGETT